MTLHQLACPFGIINPKDMGKPLRRSTAFDESFAIIGCEFDAQARAIPAQRKRKRARRAGVPFSGSVSKRD
jgi:hypothetical protein